MFSWNRPFGSATIIVLFTNFATLNMFADRREFKSRVYILSNKYRIKHFISVISPRNTQKDDRYFVPIACKTIQISHVECSLAQGYASECTISSNEHTACLKLDRVHTSRGIPIKQQVNHSRVTPVNTLPKSGHLCYTLDMHL